MIDKLEKHMNIFHMIDIFQFFDIKNFSTLISLIIELTYSVPDNLLGKPNGRSLLG